MKTFRLFSMAALALVMAACSSNDDVIQQQTAQPQGKMHFTATIEAPNADATTRTTYTESGTTINVAWRAKEDGVYEGDKIALVYNGVKVIATVTAVDPVTQAATIEAFFTGSPSDGDDVWLAYPADAVASATPSGGFPFTPNPTCWDKAHAQDGTLEFIQNNIDFRMNSGKLAVSGSDVSLKESVSMPSMISIWKLTLQDDAATPNALAATAVKVKADGDVVAGATSTTATSTYYLCMVPSFIPAGDLVIEATVGSDTYTYTKAGGVSLETGKYYQSTVTMTKPSPLANVTAADLGKVIGADGNIYADAAAAAAATTTAVAMIAYVGSGSDCEHGLAIQLNSSPVQKDRSEAGTYAAGLTAVPGGTWRLPSKADWQNMFLGCAKSGDASSASDNMNPISGFKEKIAATGITWKSDKYWSSLDYSTYATDVEVVLYGSTAYAAFAWDPKSNSHYVLGCLAF